jgi:hypothetical protein
MLFYQSSFSNVAMVTRRIILAIIGDLDRSSFKLHVSDFLLSLLFSERGSVRSVYGGAYCGDIIILVPYDFYIIYGRAYSSSYALLRIYYFTDYIRGSKKGGESKPNKRLANSG